MASSGVYVPPFRRRQMEEEEQQQMVDQPHAPQPPNDSNTATADCRGVSLEFQLEYWDALKRTLMGIVNRTTLTSVAFTVRECLRENIMRGRGLLCRAVMRAQTHSPELAPVLAALIAGVNAKAPVVGELMAKRLIFQFKRCYKRRDPAGMSAAAQFLSHLAAQRVITEVAVLKLLAVLLCGESPSRDDILVACDCFRASFAFLQERLPDAFALVLDPVRELIGSGKLDLRSSCLLDGLMKDVKRWQTQKDDVPVLRRELDIVDPDDQVTHSVDLDDDVNPELALDNFKCDPDFDVHEAEYDEFKSTIPGLDDDDFELPIPPPDAELEQSLSATATDGSAAKAAADLGVEDLTTEEVDALRRHIFLIIKSSIRADEAVHKLLKHVPSGREATVANMVAEAAVREKTYDTALGGIAELLCRANGRFQAQFEKLFVDVVNAIDDLDVRKVDIYGRFFAQMLQHRALNWRVFNHLRLTESTTTVYSRRFIKVLLQELGEHLTVQGLKEALFNAETRNHCTGLFPRDTVDNAVFAVNFFEQISRDSGCVDLRPIAGPLRSWVDQQLAGTVGKRPRDP